MDLVNRVARCVKDLEGPARPLVGLDLDGEGMTPMRGEDAQINIFGQRHRGMSTGVIVAVLPDLFVDAGRHPGQCHNLT